MNHIIAIITKELRIYFNSAIAYIFLVVFLILSTVFFFLSFFLKNQASLRDFFDWLPILFTGFMAIITMRLFAEEKRQRTLELLLTLPVKDYEVVLGKFLASAIFTLLALGLTFPLPLIVSLLGDPDLGVIFTSYLGAFLLACAYLALGIFISAYSSNQIIAWILTFALSFFLLIIGFPMILKFVPSFLVPLFEYLGFGNHYYSLSRGVIDSRDVFFFISIIFYFLCLAAWKLESRRFKF